MPENFIGPIQLLIIGIPQGFLLVLFVFLFARIKFDLKKTLNRSFFIRFLSKKWPENRA
jgi:hypothetical protein